MTYVSSRTTARLECERLLKQNGDIALVALTSGTAQRDIWLALSRSDVAVIDEEIMYFDGGETLALLLACNPGVKFLAVMNNPNEDKMLWAITHGVRGVILRRELLQLLARAIRQVHRGEVWMPRNLLNSFRDALNGDASGLVNPDAFAVNPRLRLH